MKLDLLQPDFDRCGIQPELHSCAFTDWRRIPKIVGLYSIWQEDRAIYVGQGGGLRGIYSRFEPHWHKAMGVFETKNGRSNGAVDCSGWRQGREQTWWQPQTWTVEYFHCVGAVHRTYLEGAMMLLFSPYCNDENFQDRLRDTSIVL